MNKEVFEAMENWFTQPGAYVLVDGQFGSTGKGVIAGALAECFAERVDLVMSNAGPNSGHTSFYAGWKIILKQLPTFSVIASKCAMKTPPIYLTAGAVIDPEILNRECVEHNLSVTVHPSAAYIDANDKITDSVNVKSMASTGQGVGPALIKKMGRGPFSVIGQLAPETCGLNLDRVSIDQLQPLRRETLFLEVSQGYSLGINSGFYPHVTTRECTVSQALSDAGLPPSVFRKSILSVRTFPIRVGSTENSSGPCYSDQMETSWDRIGVPQEYTTVTKRVRRVFTWSDTQFEDAVFANAPSAIYLNFLNYLRPGDVDHFVWDHVCKPYLKVMGHLPETILLGYGPTSADIKVWRP